MDDESNSSWVRRAKFSHTVCHRLGSLNSDCPSDLKPRLKNLNNSVTAAVAQLDGDPRLKPRNNYKPEKRTSSPLPATVLSDAFKEAKADKKRYSTPPPRRQQSDRSAVVHLKSRKETTWARYFDHGGGRVTAVELTEEPTVDLSKLYLGLRFASGANSRLYHGIYKEQPVAVKIIRQPDDDENGKMGAMLEKQYTREVTLLSRLYHRNVIKLVAACRNPPVFCIITKYLAGGSLRTSLNNLKLEHKSLPLEKVIAFALDIARGMEYIHSQGVIHRDLKPGNILFDEDSCVKIADFGIACEEAYCDTLAEDPGTYRWMAPEMIKHKPHGHSHELTKHKPHGHSHELTKHKPYGRKVDVYSFGLVLWEMVSGRMPYEDMSPIQAAFAVAYKNLRPVIPTSCPPALGSLIEQCWALHPEKRPEFWQIVKVIEQFEIAFSEAGTLNLVKSACQDHKKHLLRWIQKLKGPKTHHP